MVWNRILEALPWILKLANKLTELLNHSKRISESDLVREKIYLIKELKKILKDASPQELFEQVLKMNKESCRRYYIERRAAKKTSFLSLYESYEIEIYVDKICFCNVDKTNREN